MWTLAAFLLLSADPVFTLQATPTSASPTPASSAKPRLRGISAPSPQVCWASGAGGTLLRTEDGGLTWRTLPAPGGATLDFRDIDAFDARSAYALSIGPGEASRIYRTEDGGNTWELQFQNRNPKIFLDAMAFSGDRRGFVFGDSLDGHHILLRTRDGRSWHPVTNLPPALPNEGAFAASGTNIALHGQHIWIGTNAGRVLHSPDDGETWTVTATGLASSPSAGIFSIAFRDARHGIVVGGDYKQEAAAGRNAAITADGGRTWRLVDGLSGYRSVVAWLDQRRLLTVGPNGADLSEDGGRTWRRISSEGFDTLSWPAPAAGKRGANAPGAIPPGGWAAGANGRVARVSQ